MVSLVCLDVDGTLVGPSGDPSVGVWAAAARARTAGLHLAMCTARLYDGPTAEWAARLDPDGWHCFHNGAALINVGTGEQRLSPLPIDAVNHCWQTAASRGWVVEAYSADDLVADSDAPGAVLHASLLQRPHRRRSLDTLAGEVVRMQFVVDASEHRAVQEAARFGGAVAVASATSPVMPGWVLVSVTALGVSKAHALERLAALYGGSAATTMMVGDGENDLEAVETAGVGVAMGNAAPELKAVADLVVSDVDADGAAEALDEAIRLRGS